jgi:hypothetical protein
MGSVAGLSSSVLSLLTSTILPAAAILKRGEPSPHFLHRPGGIAAGFHLWAFSQAFTAILLFSTVLATTPLQGNAIIATSGITWPIGQWIPFAIMSAEVDRKQVINIGLDGVCIDKTGATLRLYNTAISGPQILSSMLCVIVYAVTDAAGSRGLTAWVLAFNGCTAVGSSLIAYETSLAVA